MVSLRSSILISLPISYSSNLFLMISLTTTSSLLSSYSVYQSTCSIELAVMPRSSMLSSLGSIFAPRWKQLSLDYSSQFKAFAISWSKSKAVILGYTCNFSPLPLLFLRNTVIISQFQMQQTIKRSLSSAIPHISANYKISESSFCSGFESSCSSEICLMAEFESSCSSEACLIAELKNSWSAAVNLFTLSQNFLLYVMRSFLMLYSWISSQLSTLLCTSIHLFMLSTFLVSYEISALIEVLSTSPIQPLLMWYFYLWQRSRRTRGQMFGFGVFWRAGQVLSTFLMSPAPLDCQNSIRFISAAFLEEVLAMNMQSLRVILLSLMTLDAANLFLIQVWTWLLVAVKKLIVLFLSSARTFFCFLNYPLSLTRFVLISKPPFLWGYEMVGIVSDFCKVCSVYLELRAFMDFWLALLKLWKRL